MSLAEILLVFFFRTTTARIVLYETGQILDTYKYIWPINTNRITVCMFWCFWLPSELVHTLINKS